MQLYLDDGGLKRQLRSPDTALSAFEVLEKKFFPERFDENGNKKVLTNTKK